jgi:ribosome-associated protein
MNQRPEQGEPDGQVEVAPGVHVRPEVLEFKFVSSGGPGGQNVNKRATKAELRVRADRLPITPRALERLATIAAGRLNDDGEIVIAADEFRSQGQNRSACLERLRELIVQAMHVPKVRRKTRPSRGSVERRISEKKKRSETKRTRRGADD